MLEETNCYGGDGVKEGCGVTDDVNQVGMVSCKVGVVECLIPEENSTG